MSEGQSPHALRAALAVAVGLVLADSPLVVLAVPEIYRDFNVADRGSLDQIGAAAVPCALGLMASA